MQARIRLIESFVRAVPPVVRTLILRSLPLVLVIVAGGLLFAVATVGLRGDIKSLAIGIAAALIAIPFVYFTYELSRLKSQRTLNARVFAYARNEMSQNIGEIHDAVALFLQGAFYYFAPGTMVVDDSGERIRVRPSHDIEAELLAAGACAGDDVLGFDKATIVEPIADARYLGYQLPDLSVDELTRRTERLLANAFIMERLDESQTQVIVHLVQSLKALDGFVGLHDDLFVRSGMCMPDYAVHKEGGLYYLWYQPASDLPEVEPIRLDVQRFMQAPDEQALLAVYVVNPDYYTIFDDLIEEVTACIRDWAAIGESGYLDYDAGAVQVLG